MILIAGELLRIAYIDHSTYNPDEQIAQAVVQELSFPNQWDTNWARTTVGVEFRYDQYNFSAYHYLLFGWKSFVTLFGHGSAATLGTLRALNGLLGALFIGAVALAAKKTVGEIAGISAACAGAIIPLLIQDAHYLRCEAMLTTGVALLLYSGTRRCPSEWWMVLLNGLVAGAMIATKVTMLLALPLLLMLLIPHSDGETKDRGSLASRAGWTSLGLMVGLGLGVPYGVAQPTLYFSGLAKLASQYGHSHVPPYTSPDMSPSIGPALTYLNGTMGWGFWLIAAAGLVPLSKNLGRWRTLLLAAPWIAALFVFGKQPYFSERSYSPFIPITVVHFGAGAQWLVETMLRQGRLTRLARHALPAVVLLVISLAVPAVYSWQLVAHGFSGREQEEKDAALALMKGKLNGKVMVIVGARFDAANRRTIETAILDRVPLLIVLNDSYDAVTPSTLAAIQQSFSGRILGVRESLFPELPTCTLHTFISPRLWLIYIPAPTTGFDSAGSAENGGILQAERILTPAQL